MTESEFENCLVRVFGQIVQNHVKPNGQETFLTVKQAARYMNCSPGFLYKLRRDDKVLAVNAGKKVLYTKSSLDKYFSSSTHRRRTVEAKVKAFPEPLDMAS